jgi:shikimate dehydrogenase
MHQDSYHFGLVGFPLGHSLSPRLHQAALRELGLIGDYSLFSIPPGTESLVKLAEVLFQIRAGVLSGVNITIPYKETVIPFLDGLTPVALDTGAVNTVFKQGDHLVGDNTDVTGFGLDLLDCGLDYLSNPGWALVLGAGGAARAVVYTLAMAGWKVTIAARRPDQAETLSRDIQRHLHTDAPSPVMLSGTALKGCADEFALIANTTPLGMAPNANTSPWPQDIKFPTHGFIYDLVYNPPETVFLHQAYTAGLATRNGLGMLVRQAAASFERWTGMVSPFGAMWNTVDEFRFRS